MSVVSVDVKGASEITAIPEGRIAEALRAGNLDGFKLGQKWYIRLEALDAWTKSLEKIHKES